MAVLRGDAVELDQTLYQRPITIEDAQAMVDLLSEQFSLRPMSSKILVQHGRTTRRKWGHADWRSGPRIVLHPMGMNEGTVIHEFAHWLAGFGAGHGPAYQRAQIRAAAVWEGK